MDNNKQILQIIKTLDKYPLEAMFVKHLILNGIDTEEKLVELLNTNYHISQVMIIKLQNAMRDVVSGFYDINKIPTLFK